MDNQAKNGGKKRQSSRHSDPDNLGQVFGTLFVASVGSFVLSSIGLTAVSAWLPEDNLTVAETDLLGVAVFTSWVGVWSSLLAYSTWSFWQLRRMPVGQSRPASRNPLKRGYELIALMFKDLEELTTYEKRLQLTVQSFVIGMVVLVGSTYLVLSGQGRGVTAPE